MQPGAHDLVGRDRLLASLDAVVQRVLTGQRIAALVAGEAGIGKTSLLRAAAATAAAGGALTVWGTCLDLDAAPGFWPWTQALEELLRATGASAGRALGDEAALVATIAPSAGAPPSVDGSERDRLLAMDATRRMLETIAKERPVLVVLDDLQWADASSLDLIDLVVRSPASVGLGVIGAYRDDELSAAARHRLSSLISRTDHFLVRGLDTDGVRTLAARTAGAQVSAEAAAALHRRTGGHPFFVRELALMGGADDGGGRVPTLVREAINRRVETLPSATVVVLEAAALAGHKIIPDVVGAALGGSPVDVEGAVRVGVAAGILVEDGGEAHFAHDLLRETLAGRLDAERRRALHRGIGVALEERVGRGAVVAPSEIARHFLASLALDGPERAVRWAFAAAAADRASLAFSEAASHLRRLRGALAAAAVAVRDEVMVEILLVEADALARGGAAVDARGLLRHAADVAERVGTAAVARVALATAQLGARFATRRDETIRQLDRAREAIAGLDDALEARVTATLARVLQHSVAEDRPRAVTLSERALELGRRAGDAATLLDCLLARHDVLWQPGGSDARVDIAREIIDVALACGDEDRHAEGLLLLANALLEQGSPAFEGPLESCLAILGALGQPRARYTVLTRRACVALLRGQLDEAERLIEEARTLGDRILEPDADNVAMSQRLELVRARGEPGELTAFADEAVAHWTGAPVHAHAVAAGFLARAGDLEGAERHLTAVRDLGTWNADRSYLWSVFMRELAHAAAALGRRELCEELLAELRPVADSCGVNGAVVAFAGSHAQPAALLADAMGQQEAAELLRERALTAYRRLGSPGWMVDASLLTSSQVPASGRSMASMRRQGAGWHLAFAGREATVPHSKGLADIARLLSAPGQEIHVLDLADAGLRGNVPNPLVDRQALAEYRERLAALDADIDDADRNHNDERRAHAEIERQTLFDEVARVTGTGHRQRSFANHPAERARKAVGARIRDTIRRLDPVLPELAAHLQRTIVTGAYCRYRPDTIDWSIDSTERPGGGPRQPRSSGTCS